MSILWFGDLVREISNHTSHLSRSRHTMRLSRKSLKNREVVIRCFDSLNQSIWNKPQMGSINKSLSSLNQTFIGEKMLKLQSVIKDRIHPTNCDEPLHMWSILRFYSIGVTLWWPSSFCMNPRGYLDLFYETQFFTFLCW